MSPNRSVSSRTRLGSLFLVGVSLLVAGAAFYILFEPIDPANFTEVTGVEWTEFSSANPDASSYLSREGRVLGIGYLSLGLIAALVAGGPLRSGNRWAIPVLWVFSLSMLTACGVFFASEDSTLGFTYLTAGILSAGAVTISSRSSRSQPGQSSI